ncbi:uncharacterized protein LOC108116400 [Drosophila eugracilis]|uniref:uncharacterized protein LOC108116400 n=1 Tax=Drosophila eugracilis TaxID=29029 RepID=UPI0007E64CB5|nr:uncharacterized protein LOC108116400 [Drosophila eugracilis]
MCEPNFSDPSFFMHLDMLSDILMRDTLELESEFNNKMQFIKEQEQECVENAKNLTSMDEVLKSINGSMVKIEIELNENETNLIEAEKAITELEERCPRSEYGAGRKYPLARATYVDLLGLLMSTEKTDAQCNQIREEIEMFNNQAQTRQPPGNMISQLIDYHTSTLECLEKQIENLQSQASKVQNAYEQLTLKPEAINSID